MKKIFFIPVLCIVLLSSCSWVSGKLQKTPSLVKAAELDRYKNKNSFVPDGSIVFIGDSFTEKWVETNPEFFESNNYIGRGIGGQSSSQLLLRFRQDVLDLNPSAVVINVGTNDIAENIGPYSPDFTLDCIKSMADLAACAGVKVILSSVLPAGEFWWKPEVSNIPVKIDDLNKQIKLYADAKGFSYIDYNSAMRDEKGGLIETYGVDGAHPSAEGYKVMEKISKSVLDNIKKQAYLLK